MRQPISFKTEVQIFFYQGGQSKKLHLLESLDLKMSRFTLSVCFFVALILNMTWIKLFHL